MEFELFTRIQALTGPGARLVMSCDGPERMVLTVIVLPFPNWCHGTMIGDVNGRDFPEPITGKWFVLKGDSERKQSPYNNAEHEQAVHAVGTTWTDAADKLVAKLEKRKTT